MIAELILPHLLLAQLLQGMMALNYQTSAVDLGLRMEASGRGPGEGGAADGEGGRDGDGGMKSASQQQQRHAATTSS